MSVPQAKPGVVLMFPSGKLTPKAVPVALGSPTYAEGYEPIADS